MQSREGNRPLQSSVDSPTKKEGHTVARTALLLKITIGKFDNKDYVKQNPMSKRLHMFSSSSG